MRRTAKIEGLKEALSMLSADAFGQKHQTLHRVSVHQHGLGASPPVSESVGTSEKVTWCFLPCSHAQYHDTQS